MLTSGWLLAIPILEGTSFHDYDKIVHAFFVLLLHDLDAHGRKKISQKCLFGACLKFDNSQIETLLD